MKSLHISVAPETIGHIGDLRITNSLLTGLIVMMILIILAFSVRNGGRKDGKSTLYIIFEYIIESLYGFFRNIAGQRTDTILPLVLTFFFFIIFGNWIGLLPGVGSIGFYEHTGHGNLFVPYLRGPNADLNATIALALISVSYTQYLSIKVLGLKRASMNVSHSCIPSGMPSSRSP